MSRFYTRPNGLQVFTEPDQKAPVAPPVRRLPLERNGRPRVATSTAVAAPVATLTADQRSSADPVFDAFAAFRRDVLRAAAESFGIEGPKRLTKRPLIEALISAGATPADVEDFRDDA